MRSEDEVLAMVRAKADGIRRHRRRLVTASTGSLAFLLVVSGMVAVATGGSEDASVTAGGGDNSAADTATSTTATAPDMEADEDANPPATTETTLTTRDPDAEQEAQDTETAEHDETYVSDSTSTSSTVPPVPPVCPASGIEMSVTTDRSTYTPDDEILITAEGTNRAGRDCAHADSSETVIQDQDGQVITQWAVASARSAGDCCWRSDATQRSQDRWHQDSMQEGNPKAPPGDYTVTITWFAMDDSGERATYTGSAAFTIEMP